MTGQTSVTNRPQVSYRRARALDTMVRQSVQPAAPRSAQALRAHHPTVAPPPAPPKLSKALIGLAIAVGIAAVAGGAKSPSIPTAATCHNR